MPANPASSALHYRKKMGKNDFMSPKAVGALKRSLHMCLRDSSYFCDQIGNRIKAKGLQKLRWYCQLCQKQCRDENGFKCHQVSPPWSVMASMWSEQFCCRKDSQVRYGSTRDDSFTTAIVLFR
jgi:hypothetical protein